MTTLENHEALTAASAFLQSRGFIGEGQMAFPVGGAGWNSLEMKRGRKNAARARSVAELPQSIRLDFDRGRITVAASIASNAAWGGRSWGNVGFGVNADNPYHPKRMKLHTDLLMGITRGLERLLAERAGAEAAGEEWAAAEKEIDAARRRRRRRNAIILVVVFLFFAAVIGLVIYASTHRW